jgi:AcrR family transcriptional regulator
MDTRTELLKAAAQVFAQHGSRGSTTRRIAEAAGVNEVTLFRYFGSKDALLKEAIVTSSDGAAMLPLPNTPEDPESELAAWCGALIERLRSKRSIIRKCMSEAEERPEMIGTAVSTPMQASHALTAYLKKLKLQGLADAEFDIPAAAAMLMGAIFHDAMGRDMMPNALPPSTKAARLYSRLLLRAVGFKRNGAQRHKPSQSS